VLGNRGVVKRGKDSLVCARNYGNGIRRVISSPLSCACPFSRSSRLSLSLSLSLSHNLSRIWRNGGRQVDPALAFRRLAGNDGRRWRLIDSGTDKGPFADVRPFSLPRDTINFRFRSRCCRTGARALETLISIPLFLLFLFFFFSPFPSCPGQLEKEGATFYVSTVDKLHIDSSTIWLIELRK